VKVEAVNHKPVSRPKGTIILQGGEEVRVMGLPDGVLYLGDIGVPRVLAGYLVDGGSESAMIETGPSNLAPEYLSKAESRRPNIKWALVSHVHLDHAGGAWRIVALRPQVKIGVYERGYKHLLDPSRLSVSAKDAVGGIFDVWGDIRPTPAANLVALKDGDVLRVGKFVLRLIGAPGHAPHSSVWYLEDERVVFSGDALGIYVDFKDTRFVWPTTPPPTYDHDLAVKSLNLIRTLKIDAVCFPHYGYTTNVDEVFRLIDEGFNAWFEVTRKAVLESWGEGKVLEELSRRLPLAPLLGDRYLESLLRMDIRGMIGYHRRKMGGT
jgi:glyoxylase-like metal-dependent hydrolase (beta-lactamase superfamily II)